MIPTHVRRPRRVLPWAASAALAVVLAPVTAHAVARTCGVDAVANTTNVLCASPSGPCTGSAVTMSTDIEVTLGSCTFDLGGRTLSIQKSFQITGLGTLKVINAGNITITGSGRLKARGDFVEPNNFVVRGGTIDLTSSGVITLLDRAQIDVSGDSAGIIRLTASGVSASGLGVDLQATAQIFAQGFSMASEGERYSDGGTFSVKALAGGINDQASIFAAGANQAQGGSVDLRAARNVTIDEDIDASGGGSDGGDITVIAGDNITISKSLNADSRGGGGFGGTMSLSAGFDTLGGLVPGGTLTIDDSALELNGSDAETFGGDGGDIDVSAKGDVTFSGAHAAIRASGGTLFDGSGGSIAISSGDSAPNSITALDGNITMSGDITAQSGGLAGDGGIVDFSAGRSLTLTATIDMSGKDTGGDVTGDAGSTILLNGVINAQATNTTGGGGFVDFTSGLAQNAGLTLAKNINAVGGSSNGSGQSISLAGCTVTVNNNIKVDGHGGTSSLGALGGSDIDLISRTPMHLNNGSQYLANPGGRITTTHPPSQTPVIGTGVVFNPARIDNPSNTAAYPNCPVCADGIRQNGEACDDGGVAAGDGCSPTCAVETGWTCTGSPSICKPICGDGTRLGAEECDDGNLVSGDGCDSNCTTTRCGNGAVSPIEQCDDGNAIVGDGCAGCILEPGFTCVGEPSVCIRTCGDGVTAPNEECDDANVIDGDGCDSNCTITRCGNGILTAGEQCEDGNTQNGDCCSSTCQFESPGSSCAADTNPCTNDVCNGAGSCVHPNNTAPCNDGNACTTLDSCLGGTCLGGPALGCNDNNVCTTDACVPATGCTHTANTLTCDDGFFCTVNDRCQATVCQGTARDCSDTNACSADSCDEGADQCVHDLNALNGTPCQDNLFCTVNDACQGGSCTGPARDCSAAGDQCHVGVCNETNDVCAPQLKPTGTPCNDGQVCTINDQCTATGTCTGNPMTCGDGTVQSTCNETCDDGNLVNGDGCDANCTPTACGNGIVTAGEQCDDHDLSDGDGCSATCTIESGWACTGQPSVCHEVCGDGVVTAGEQCDDGNTLDRDGCSATCRQELCGALPATGCRRPIESGKAAILIKDQPNADDVLVWKWIKGAATTKSDFGAPTFNTSYAVCIYDESGPTPQLKLSASAPAGGFCGNTFCWRDKTGGFTYADKNLTPDGIAKLILKSGSDDTAKITLKGKGSNLRVPSLTALGQPLVVQVRNSNGLCWEAIYSAPATKQTAEQFKDKAD